MATPVVVGRALHAPWNEGTRVIGRNIGLALRNAGFATRMVSLSNTAYLGSMGSDPYDIDHIGSRISSEARFAALSDYRYLFKVARALRAAEHPGSTSIYHLVGLPLALAPFVRQPGHRVVAHVTLSQQAYRPRHERLRAALGWRAFSQWIDAFACTSEQIRGDLQHLGYHPRKLHVVPPPTDLELFQPMDRAEARCMLGWNPEAFIVLYIGTVSPLRFPADDIFVGLSQAMPHVPGMMLKVFAPLMTHRYNVTWAETNVHRAMQGSRVPVELCLADLDERQKALHYSAADVVLLPFAAPVAVEPPLTLLEAMACEGVIVIAPYANRSAVVDNGVNGMTYSSPEELSARLRELSHMGREGRAALGCAARMTIQHRYSGEVTARAIEAMWAALGVTRAPLADRSEAVPAAR